MHCQKRFTYFIKDNTIYNLQNNNTIIYQTHSEASKKQKNYELGTDEQLLLTSPIHA